MRTAEEVVRVVVAMETIPIMMSTTKTMMVMMAMFHHPRRAMTVIMTRRMTILDEEMGFNTCQRQERDTEWSILRTDL
jgi:hypothetical protein